MAQDFESRLAEVAMLQVDVMKVVLVHLSDRADSVTQNGPAELHDFIFCGGKRAAGEPDNDRGKE